ncbi:MAG: acylphosphatase [Desulfobacterales bacterium]|jgi:acylphosphatase|nr:acylphosphatase [Desulfobacteraceae bacterium]MDD3991586.1 acylphosphatase [Desulfobacteraceae bacterium]MDY0311435.1 acylphosphatase [Desulfobacterales bacterium]
MAEPIARHLIVTGRVQGVFYRLETQRAAEGLGIKGWVRNLPDGTVEAVIEGAPRAVEAMIDWCRQGPPRSRVDAVHVEPLAGDGGFRDFEIRY